jgi:hypothetical protein
MKKVTAGARAAAEVLRAVSDLVVLINEAHGSGQSAHFGFAAW